MAQELDVNEGNFPIAAWALALSSLPHLRTHCLSHHFKHISLFLHSALSVVCGEERECEGVMEGESGGVTVGEVAQKFLCSETFQELRELQETVVGLCFEKAATCLPKRFAGANTPSNTHTHTHTKLPIICM